MSRLRLALPSLALFSVLFGAQATCQPAPAPAPFTKVQEVDLAKPFGARAPWRLEVTQGPPTEDYGGNPAPGEIHLCLRRGPAGSCVVGPLAPSSPEDAEDAGWAPHYFSVRTVFPRGSGGPPLLQISTASVHAGDGGQVLVTNLLRYDPAGDTFSRVYFHRSGSNNNQEARFIAGGPLRGDVISADPTDNAPYGYWIVVNTLGASGFRQVLRYRSATRYNDGNTLAVIDSEMPNIESRLGLWKPGAPLPLPTGSTKPCARPTMKKMELWCG